MGLQAQFHRWAELLPGISAWAPPLQAAIQSTKIWGLTAVSPSTPFYLITSGQALQIPPAIPVRWDPSGSVPQCWESWMSIWAPSSPWRNHRLVGGWGLMQCCAGLWEGCCGQSAAAPLTLLMWYFLISEVRGETLQSHLPPAFWVFTMVSCLWIVTIWLSCEAICLMTQSDQK